MKHTFIRIVVLLVFSAVTLSSFSKSSESGAHHTHLKKTFKLAMSARQKGNHPFGALLVHNGKVILTAENNVVQGHDITAHAELVLVREASKRFPKSVLENATLYTSTEPCAMCAGAIYWAGISHVVFGTAAETLGQIAGSSFVIPSRNLFEQGTRPIKVEGPILEAAANKVHKGFWTS